MFDEQNINIYNADKTLFVVTTGDVRVIEKELQIDGMSIFIDFNVFIPKINGVTNKQYITFSGYDSNTYRCIKVIPHTDYLELYLAKCEVIQID